MYKNRPLVTPIKTYDELFSYYPCNILLICDENNAIHGGLMWWQTVYGNKISTSFSHNSEIYKKNIIDKYAELLTTNGFYAELSDSVEHLLRKKGLDNLKSKSLISQLTGVKNEDIFEENDKRRNEYPLGKNNSPSGSYLRYINGVGYRRKAIYGMPCVSKKFNKSGCDRACIN